MPDTVAARVVRVITKTQKLPDGRVAETSTFRDLNVDSLDGLNILFALEEEFGIEIPDEAAKQFASVPEVVAAVERLIASRA